MAGETPLKPTVFETLAQAYATRIDAGEIEIDSVPAVPVTLRPRVEYLVNRE